MAQFRKVKKQEKTTETFCYLWKIQFAENILYVYTKYIFTLSLFILPPQNKSI